MKIVGWVCFEFPVTTLGDLHAALREVDAAGLPDHLTVEMSWSRTMNSQVLYVSGDDTMTGELIQCGEHVGEQRFVVLLPVHKCGGSDAVS